MGVTIGVPQAIWLTLLAISLIRTTARYGERKPPDTYDAIDLFVGPGITIGLLYWGGFFGGGHG